MIKRYSPYISEPDLTTLTVEAKMGEHPQGRYIPSADYDALVALGEDVFAWNDWEEFAEWRKRFEALTRSPADGEVKP